MATQRRDHVLRPVPRDRFTFGLWTVGNTGRDPFGAPTRPALAPAQVVDLLGAVGGVYGVNFHDNDLVPIDAPPREAELIKRDFSKALRRNNIAVAMATTNLFSDPVFRDGAFTSNDGEVRAYALQKTMRAMDLGAEFGARVFVFWGGREGVEAEGTKDPVEAEARYRRAINFLCAYARSRRYRYRFALEAKPNEPRAHLFFPTTGSYLAFIGTLDDPDMVGVNPEVAHEHMAGLNMTHAVAQALGAGKLFHIDLNDQQFGRYDQDFRFGAADLRGAFFLVKLLEDHGYTGFRHFDAHAYRTSDPADVIAFARGCMRTYLALRERARRWNADPVVRDLLAEIRRPSRRLDALGSRYSTTARDRLLAMRFDRERLAARPLPYEALDQRTTDILMGLD